MDTGSLAFIFICLVGIALIVVGILKKNKAAKAAKTWLPTSGIILGSRVETRRSRDSEGNSKVSYHPVVDYQYQVIGQSFNGDRIGFSQGNFASAKADKLIAPYQEGAQVTVYYDPSDPSQAVLVTKDFSTGSMTIVGIILLVLGLFGIIMAIL